MAQQQRCRESELIRQALDQGLDQLLASNEHSSAAGLLELAAVADKLGDTGPSDLSTRHDDYLWGE